MVSAYAEHHIVVVCLSAAERSCGVSGWFVLVFPTLHPSPSLVPPLSLLTQCDGCPDDYAWGQGAHGWIARGLPAMGVCYCLGAGWSHWRPLDFPGTLLPLSLMCAVVNKHYKNRNSKWQKWTIQKKEHDSDNFFIYLIFLYDLRAC